MYTLMSLWRKPSAAAMRLFSVSDITEEDAEEGEEFQKCFSRLSWTRSRLSTIAALSKATGLSGQELRCLYRTFKVAYPTGVVGLDDLKITLSKFYPGDCAEFAVHLIRALDSDFNNEITFDELAMAVALLDKASIEDLLIFAFRIYDVDGDGRLSRTDITTVLKSVYLMVGDAANDDTVQRHVSDIFLKFGLWNEDFIPQDKFISVCQSEKTICDDLLMFRKQSAVYHNTPEPRK